MMGCSPYMTRDELIVIKATGVQPELSAIQHEIFDKGHRFEALARPLAEEFIGEMLSPVTETNGDFSASLDGATFTGTILFEHKTLNDSIRGAYNGSEDIPGDGCELPLHYRVQMEHQAMCGGENVEKVLFMASKWSDDNELLEELKFW